MRAGKGGPHARAAFEQLVALFEERLFNFMLRRCRTRDEAEDLTQEAFVRAWERIASYNPAWRFSTWLFTIAMRQAISRHRKSKHESRGEPPEQITPPAEDTSGDRDLGARLWALAAERLTSDQHTALWLRYAEDMRVDEIAKVMKKSGVGVRVCLFRARQALAAMAEASGSAPPRATRDHDTPRATSGSRVAFGARLNTASGLAGGTS